jgi:hypothetical protein
MFLVHLRMMVKNRVLVLLSQHDVEPLPLSDLFGKKGLTWLKEESDLPDPDGWLLREDIELAEVLKERFSSTGDLIAELAEDDEVVR